MGADGRSRTLIERTLSSTMTFPAYFDALPLEHNVLGPAGGKLPAGKDTSVCGFVSDRSALGKRLAEIHGMGRYSLIDVRRRHDDLVVASRKPAAQGPAIERDV